MNAGTPEQQTAFEAADRAKFQVGGHEEKLPPQDQLTQLSSYIQAHYPAPQKNPPWSDNPSGAQAADTFDARLPDRITHASMLMLGAAVDHSMPGIAWGRQVTTSPAPMEVGCAAEIITPSQPNGNWAISLHPGGWWKGSGVALEHAWRPEVAAAAERSGVTFLDLDYPLVPEHDLNEVITAVQQAIAWVRSKHPEAKVFAWGYSSGGALAVLNAAQVDALALTFPHLDLTMLPDSVRVGVDFQTPASLPPTLLQYANSDSIASTYKWFEQWYDAANLKVREYISEHRIATPEVMRQRVADVAEFFRAQSEATEAAKA